MGAFAVDHRSAPATAGHMSTERRWRQPRCLVAMEACAGAHYWAREIGSLGHDTRLIPPSYVKPFVKRQKNDAADAEAICEAAQRPTMRFVTPKSAEAKGATTVFRTRDLLVRQRTQMINALRGHLPQAEIERRPLLAANPALPACRTARTG